MEQLIKNISDTPFLDTGRLFVIPMNTKDLVSFTGSLVGGHGSLPIKKDAVPSFVVSLLDTGTKNKTKAQIRELLASRGASLGYSSGLNRLSFSGSCLPEDLETVLGLAAECLQEATFPAAELKKLRERTQSRLIQSATDTAKQSARALMRALYDQNHPNYTFDDVTYKKRYDEITRNDLVNFYRKIGSKDFVLAISGDIAPAAAKRVATKAFSSMSKGSFDEPKEYVNTKKQIAKEQLISIPDKANIDVVLGASVQLKYGDPLYYATVLLMDMLGGGFTSHLMQTVRERDGLTYNVGAGLYSTGIHVDGYVEINALFSPELYEKGVATIRKEIKNFLQSGLTSDTLAKKKEEFIGAYPLSFSTTSGMANKLVTLGTRHQSVAELQEYIEHIKSVTLKKLREAVNLIPFDSLSLASAGTFASKNK